MTSKETKLYGLVLAGGHSTRMGQDKSRLNWHGKEQMYHMADLLKEYCEEVYISCRAEQTPEIDSRYKTIADSADGKGPAVGILSALSTTENKAWLVVACDLPLIDRDTLSYLIEHRDIQKVATTYKSPHDGLPEPLITIWEPKAKAVLQDFQQRGYSCPRKALINSDTLIIEPNDSQALINTNTPEEATRVKEILNQKATAS